jgi:hypothetical protein
MQRARHARACVLLASGIAALGCDSGDAASRPASDAANTGGISGPDDARGASGGSVVDAMDAPGGSGAAGGGPVMDASPGGLPNGGVIAADARPTTGGTPDARLPEPARPLPRANVPTVRPLGCRTYGCETVVPEGTTVAWSWRLNDQVLPDRTLTGEAFDRNGQTLDLTRLGVAEGMLTCSVRFADERAQFGPAARSEPLTTVSVLPSYEGALLSPEEPVPGQPLTCQIGALRYGACPSDDVHPEFRFTVDGQPYPGADQAELSAILEPGREVQCFATPVGLGGYRGPEVASNRVSIVSLEPGALSVEVTLTGDAATPVRCAPTAGGVAPPGTAYWWEINESSAFPAGETLTADQVGDCDRVQCFAVLPGGRRTLRAEARLPLGADCDFEDTCATPTCRVSGGCGRAAVGGAVCNAGACGGAGLCVDAVCVPAENPCDDGEPCTVDTCGEGGACAHAPADAVPCDNGDPCTQNDRCAAGACLGRQVCGCEADVDCNDGDPCTAERCEAGACVYPASAGDCSDGDACTSRDQCVQGRCVGVADPCEPVFEDEDADGFGAPRAEGAPELCACRDARPGRVADDTDCDDHDPNVNPDALDSADDGVDADCDGRETIGEQVVQVGEMAGEPPPVGEPVPIVGEFDFGPLGQQQAQGEVTRSEDGSAWCVSAAIFQTFDEQLTLDGAIVELCRDADGHRTSTVLGAARIAGIPVTIDGTLSLEAPFDYRLDLTGTFDFHGAGLPILVGRSRAERSGGALSWGFEARLSGFPAAPGIELEELVLTAGPGGLGVTAYVRIGDGDLELRLSLGGTLAFDGTGEVVLSLPEGTRWTPFGPGVPLGDFDRLAGTLTFGAGNSVSAAFELGLAGDLRLFNALTLAGLVFRGEIDDTGHFAVGLEADTEFDLGDAGRVPVHLAGSLEDARRFSLEGSVEGALEPLFDVAGPDVLVLEGNENRPFAVAFSVDVAERSVAATIDVPATMQFPGAPDPVSAFVHAEGVFAFGEISWLFQAVLDELELPVLGMLPTVAVIATTADATDVDLFRDGSTFRDVPAGVTLAVTGDAPFHLEGMADTVLFILQLVPAEAKLIVEADLGLSIDMIRPDMHVPGIARVTLTRLALTGEFSAAGAQLGIESEIEMLPDNQDDTLAGYAALNYTPPAEFGGTLALTGLWLEPIGLRNFGIQNPAFTVAATISPALGIPVPTRLGWNLDIFWKKYGRWPNALPPAVDRAPENVLAVGSSFVFDKEPSPSGLCILGLCPSLPPLAVRFNFENLTTEDIIAVINDVLQGLLAFFPGAAPDGELEVPDLSPFEMTARTLRFEASTHDMDFFGQPLHAGIHALIDGSLSGADVLMEGRLDPDGLLLHGEVDAIELPPYFSLSGDSFQRELRGASTRTMPADGVSLNPGMLEAFIEVNGACNVEIPVFTRSGNAGVSLALGRCSNGARPLIARVTNGTTRTITSESIVPTTGRFAVGVQFQGADAALYLDGARLSVVSDDAPALAPGALTAWTVGGSGVAAIDDVHVFSGVVRTTAEIGAQARRLPTRLLNAGGSYRGSPLLRAYEFDYDTQRNDGRNAREGLPGAYTLTGPADGSLVAPRDNPIRLTLDVPNPLSDLRAPSFGVQAGFEISLPLLPDAGLKATLDGELGEDTARFRFRAAPFQLLQIPGLGAFVISGNGRNLLDDDDGYDDGMYGEIDLVGGYFSGSAAFEWVGDDGTVQRFLEGAAVLDIPNEYLALAANMDWTIDPGCGDTGVHGSARYNDISGASVPTNPPSIAVSGSVVICGAEFGDVEASLSQNEIRFEQGWSWGLEIPGSPVEVPAELMGATTRYVMNFAEGYACGEAEFRVNGTTCHAQVCFSAGTPELSVGCDLVCGDGTCGVFGDPLPGLEYCGASDRDSPICNADCGTCLVAGLCESDSDCASENCVLGLCVPSIYCGDGTCGAGGVAVLGVERCGNGNSGDTCQPDCGKCEIGGLCDFDNDCRVGRCDRVTAACVPRCGDGTCSVGEVCGGVDSGLTCMSDCGRCPDGVPCTDNGTCSSHYCAGVCTSNPCGNGRCDNIPFVETCGAGNSGPECQQDCGKCTGVATCNSNDDCVSNSCVGGFCETCGDGVCTAVVESCGNGDNGLACERDCGKCPDFTPCLEHGDCASNYCLGLCQRDPCGDGQCIWLPGVEMCGSGNGDGVCEGDCGRCEWGGLCDEDADCYSSNCVEFLCGAPKRNCGDGYCVDIVGIELCGEGNSGDTCETDCGKCWTGAICDRDGDCEQGNCLNVDEGWPGFCAGCGDGQCTPILENCGRGTSPGVCQRDCGLCGVAGFCDSDSDCRSNNCVAGFCAASCGDGTCSFGELCGGPRTGGTCHADCGYCGKWTPCVRTHDCVNECVLGFCN